MKQVVILHPDLGIGGAERLVVDAALALKKKKYGVYFITSHHDPTHCFSETKDGTFPVTVVGDWLPRNIFGKFYALCAYFRMIYAALYLVFFSGLKPDLVLCDLVSVCIPILKLRSYKVLFYCHFPDQLLSKPGSTLKSIYRAPLNWLEEVTTGQADRILVNSRFTASVFKQTFKRIQVTPTVLHPSLNTDFFDKIKPEPINNFIESQISKDSFLFVSINRYERKKNVALALEAMEALQSKLPTDSWDKVHLIIAGGYDLRVLENVEYYDELVEKYRSNTKLRSHVTFLRSPSDLVKMSLLNSSSCLIYTPENEHFGIVPLEAMYCRKPVIAVKSGGPTETIVNDVTGYLCNPDRAEFAEAMEKCVQNPAHTMRMGENGRKRVEENFSFTAFTNNLDSVVSDILESKKQS